MAYGMNIPTRFSGAGGAGGILSDPNMMMLWDPYLQMQRAGGVAPGATGGAPAAAQPPATGVPPNAEAKPPQQQGGSNQFDPMTTAIGGLLGGILGGLNYL